MLQLGMLGLDAPGHPARVARRPERPDHADDSRRRDRDAQATTAATRPGSTACSERDPTATRAQTDAGPRQPAERQTTPEPLLPEPPRDLFQCLSQFVCSCRQCLRAGRAGSLATSPRQPGFDDQDADRRQNQPAPELLAVFELRVVHLPELLVVDALRGMVRQPAAELFQCSTCSGAVLLSSGSRFTANDRAPAGVSTV